MAKCNQLTPLPFKALMIIASDTPSLLKALYLLIPLSHQNLHFILLPGNNCNQTDTLTQRAAFSQFVIDYFFFESLLSHTALQDTDNFTGCFGSSNISRNSCPYAIAASYL